MTKQHKTFRNIKNERMTFILIVHKKNKPDY